MNYKISDKRSSKNIFDHLAVPCVYKGIDYGFHTSLTGNGVKICVIDTGMPDHPDITNIIDSVDMSEPSRDNLDHHGHSTMISGIISSKNSRAITGIAPNTELLFAKVVNQDGEAIFNAIIASILWSIVKQTDIILISLGCLTDYPILHDAIKKAYNQGICILAAAGNTNNQIEYPANYPEVLSIGKHSYSKNGKFESIPQSGINIVVPDCDMQTTYLHGRYTKASGTSLVAALGSGLASLIIEKAKENKTKITPNYVYAELASLSYKCIK